MTAAEGSKKLVQDLIYLWKIKRGGSPALILKKLTDIYNVLEDVYSVSGTLEIQEAIDLIGDGSGTIFIEAGTHSIETTIDIDGGGSLVIYGHGDNTVLQAADGIDIFNVTDCESLVVKNLKFDVTNYTSDQQAIVINETANNVIGFQDITIDGAGSNGIGIEIQSDNCIVENCNITDLKKGIYVNNSDNHIIHNSTITGNAQYGIHLDTTTNNTITGNTISTHTTAGIYADTVTYSIISSNTCNSSPTGIYLTGNSYNTISGNTCNSNTLDGLYLTGSSYNTVSSNNLVGNDSNTANPQAGLYITSNSDYNTISSNSVNNNNNSGAGTGYGIYIAAATCDENVIAANNANGNDIDYFDTGTGTSITYYVQDATELQDAIDSIGTGTGTIIIDTGAITIATTIDIDGGGAYIIEGQGDNTVLTTSGDIVTIDITSAKSCLLRNFKIDASSLVTATKEIININEGSHNPIIVDNLTIIGDGVNGYGIEINSQNSVVQNCRINNVNEGVRFLFQHNRIESNVIDNCASYGVYINGDYSIISSNDLNTNVTGLYISGASYNTVNANSIYSNTENGIFLNISNSNSITANHITGNDSNTANPQAGIYIDNNSDNNAIIGNTIIQNNNAGAGTTYGIYIANANCTISNIVGNITYGNDVRWKDNGINTDIIYKCSSNADIQDAIDSIAGKSGVIQLLNGTISVSTQIDVDGGGNYIIVGQGRGTIITASGNLTIFNITSAASIIVKDFKIDVQNYAMGGTDIIVISAAITGKVLFENLWVYGNAQDGTFLDLLNVDFVEVRYCEVERIDDGLDTNNCSNLTVDGCNFHNLIGNAVDGEGQSNSMTITNNKFQTISQYAVYFSNCDFCKITNNYMDSCNDGSIYLTGCDSTTIIGNNCGGSTSADPFSQAAIYIHNTHSSMVMSNFITANTNTGANTFYGVYISTTSNDNVIKLNDISNNDAQWMDLGNDSDMEYRCLTATDIQQAIDSIAAKSGIIEILSGTIALSAAIDVDGGGVYTIQGQGDGTIIDLNGVWSAFNITDCIFCELKNFKIDTSGLGAGETENTEIIVINETGVGDSPVVIDNITIDSLPITRHGHFVAIHTDNAIVQNCNFNEGYYGIRILTGSSNNRLINNNMNDCVDGILIESTYNVISNNVLYENDSAGIRGTNGASYNVISNNNCHDNVSAGIHINGTTATSEGNVISGNNCADNGAWGIYIYDNCDNNAIIGNVIANISISVGSDIAAIRIQSNCDNNTISGNNIFNNTNTGAGDYYGIDIFVNTDDNNIISGNNLDNNDVNIRDNGTGTAMFQDNLIQTSGTLQLKVSGDNDDYLEFSSTGSQPIITAQGTDGFKVASSNANWSVLYWSPDDGTNWDMYLGTHKIGNYQQLYCTNSFNLITNGDADDYLEFSSDGTFPYITTIGTNQLRIASDQNEALITFWEDGGNYVYFGWDKINSHTVMYSEGAIKIYCGDSNDYFELYASSNIPIIHRIGGNDFTIESDLGTIDIMAQLMIGSANAAWIPCMFDGDSDFSFVGVYSSVPANKGANNLWLSYTLPLPTNRGGDKLHIGDLLIHVKNADGNDYINWVYVDGHTYVALTNLYNSSTNRQAPSANETEYTYATGEGDVSAYWKISVRMNCIVATASELQIEGVYLKCWYA